MVVALTQSKATSWDAAFRAVRGFNKEAGEEIQPNLSGCEWGGKTVKQTGRLEPPNSVMLATFVAPLAPSQCYTEENSHRLTY